MRRGLISAPHYTIPVSENQHSAKNIGAPMKKQITSAMLALLLFLSACGGVPEEETAAEPEEPVVQAAAAAEVPALTPLGSRRIIVSGKSASHTLTEEEVVAAHTRVLDTLSRDFNATLREL